MRGKRSKQYRKLMEQFSMTFGFREPYQVLVDAEMVKDSCRFKMDLAPALQRTVHGQVKPMITQCEIRKLYAQNKEPGVADAIDLAKTLERRRCGHHPDQYPEPLSTEECMKSVVDPKGSGQNKHRYVVASQVQEVRRMLRGIKGVPLIYIKRSVMILEPMADESVQLRAREERGKFRAELRGSLGKRKRGEDDDSDEEKEEKDGDEKGKQGGDKEGTQGDDKKKKKKTYGRKQPNPLAVQKAKKQGQQKREQPQISEELGKKESGQEGSAKRKRRRKAKTGNAETAEGQERAALVEAVGGDS
ncbi:Fcf1-domain-containing protein [Dactylonectria macrodidyma]|uniref:U three protein 23 n=1 Tax=Dactylonectria macrodidyma TaxID=307937 RepID=A0A9P9FRY4_9HYPO|nr:Fcf1-domain-containing protein [Dactylonectria macrodidyma]